MLVPDIKVIEMSFVLMRSPWVGSWMGAGHQKDHDQKLGIFSPTPYSPKEGREARSAITDRSCLCDESSVKIPKLQGSESFQLVSTWGCWRGMDAPRPFPHTSPCARLPSGCSAVPFTVPFYSKLVNSK